MMKKMIILLEMKIGYQCSLIFFEVVLANTRLPALTYIG